MDCIIHGKTKLNYRTFQDFVYSAFRKSIKNCRIIFWQDNISATDQTKRNDRKFLVTLQSSTSLIFDENQYVIDQHEYNNYKLHVHKVTINQLRESFRPTFDHKIVMDYSESNVSLDAYYKSLGL
jgi:hypothetical protein